MADPIDPQKIVELLAEQAEKNEDINKLIEKRIQSNERLAELAQKGGDQNRNHLEIIEEMLKNESKIIDLNRESIFIQKQELELQKEQGKLGEEDYQTQLKNLETEEQNLAIKVKEYELDKKRNTAEKNTADHLTKSITSITGISTQSNTLLGNMSRIAMSGGSFKDAFAAVGKNLAQTLTFTNLIASGIDKLVQNTINLFLGMDKTFSDFEKKAGGVDAFKGRIVELRDSNVEYALSLEEAGAAFSDLKVQFAGFAGVSKGTQDQLAATTAQMTKLGVSSGETIKIQNMLVKGFQMTGQQAGDVQKQLMATAKAMGLPMQKVVGEFANASNGLKAHGANMQKVFLDLQNQSKNLGVEFSRLQDITGKFDTFEGAADAAGQLNAILGGDYLNSIQLLNADEGERIRLMQESLKASGRSFESMSKQEKMATAQALGLQNGTELQQFMNNSVEQGTVAAMNKERAEKELAKSVQDVTTMQEKLTAIMAQFAIVLTPVLDSIKWLLTTIGEWMSKSAAFKSTIFVLIGAFALLFVVLKGASIIGGLVSGFKNFGDTIKGTKKPIEDTGSGIANSIKEVGQAASGSAKGLLALGLTFIMIGGAIAIAALGLAELVKAFTGLGGKQVLGAVAAIIVVMGGFILMMYAMIPLLAALGALMASGLGSLAILGILALGAAFLMMGAGIALAAVGISQLVKAIVPLAEILVGGLVRGFELVVELIKTLGSMSVTNLLGIGPALFGVAAGLAAIAAAGVGSSIAGLASGVIGAVGGALGLGSAAKNPLDMLVELGGVVSAFPVAQLDKIATAINSLTESLSNTIGSDLVNNLKSIVEEVNNLNLIKITALASMSSAVKTNPTISTTAAAANANNAGSANAGGGTNIVPVAVYLDSKKIGEILDPRIKQTIQDSLKNIGSKTVAATGM